MANLHDLPGHLLGYLFSSFPRDGSTRKAAALATRAIRYEPTVLDQLTRVRVLLGQTTAADASQIMSTMPAGTRQMELILEGTGNKATDGSLVLRVLQQGHRGLKPRIVMDGLRIIHLEGCALGASDAHAAGQAIRAHCSAGLTTLKLEGTKHVQDLLRALTAAPSGAMQQLRHLHITGLSTALSASAAAQLVAEINTLMPQLESLTLHRDQFGAAHAPLRACVPNLKSPTLQHLNLNHLRMEQLAALLSGDEGADLPVLRTVHLDRLFMPDMTLTLGAILGGQFERAACTQVALLVNAVGFPSLTSLSIDALHSCAAKFPIQGVRALNIGAEEATLPIMHGMAELFPGTQDLTCSGANADVCRKALASMAVLPNLNQLKLISFDEEVNTPTGVREVAQGLEALAAAGASKAVHVEFDLAPTFFSYHQVVGPGGGLRGPLADLAHTWPSKAAELHANGAPCHVVFDMRVLQEG